MATVVVDAVPALCDAAATVFFNAVRETGFIQVPCDAVVVLDDATRGTVIVQMLRDAVMVLCGVV
jgi:hypothetical protein